MSNLLITKTGRIIDCENGDHSGICHQKLKISLTEFLLKRGGVRTHSSNSETLAIEYHQRKPTEQQISIINRILRENDYFTVILTFKTIAKYRPIRGLRL